MGIKNRREDLIWQLILRNKSLVSYLTLLSLGIEGG